MQSVFADWALHANGGYQEILDLLIEGLTPAHCCEGGRYGCPRLQHALSLGATAAALTPKYRIDGWRSLGTDEGMFGAPTNHQARPHLHAASAGLLFATRRRAVHVRFAGPDSVADVTARSPSAPLRGRLQHARST